MTEQALTHLNASGQAHMVDVSAKPPTRRRATADARVHMSAEAASAIAESSAAKGDVCISSTLEFYKCHCVCGVHYYQLPYERINN